MGNRRDPNARWWRDMELFQKRHLEFVINQLCDGSVNRAAKYLGLNHGYVYRLVKKLGVDVVVRPYNKTDEERWGTADDTETSEAPDDEIEDDETPDSDDFAGDDDFASDDDDDGTDEDGIVSYFARS